MKAEHSNEGQRKVAEITVPLQPERAWVPTFDFRWYRPPGGTDADLVLQQLWVAHAGGKEWRELPTVLAD